jgi:hypothetical protein
MQSPRIMTFLSTTLLDDSHFLEPRKIEQVSKFLFCWFPYSGRFLVGDIDGWCLAGCLGDKTGRVTFSALFSGTCVRGPGAYSWSEIWDFVLPVHVSMSFMDYRGKSCEHTHPVLCRASESQHARKRFAALRWWKAPLKKLGLLATVGR